MSKNQLFHYVARTNFGSYWAGMNSVTDQIRKAQMYNSVKAIKENVSAALKKYNKSLPTEYQITSFDIIAVQIIEGNIVESVSI